MIAAYASQPHYWRHLAPVVDALRARGGEADVWAPEHGRPWGEAVTPLRRHEVAPLVLVASPADADRWKDRAVVYVEHGAGQTYCLDGTDLRPQDLRFAGSPGLDNVVLFLTPSERVADLWRASYPRARAEVVGCPALDRYFADQEVCHGVEASGVARRESLLGSGVRVPMRGHHSGTALDRAGRVARGRIARGPGPANAVGDLEREAAGSERPGAVRSLVAITCHWRMGGAALPEADPALPHFIDAFPETIAAFPEIDWVGHSHPRIATEAKRWWAEMEIPFEPDPDVVLSTADLLIADTTSLLFEACAVDLPTLVLNAPWYRRDVHHGLRWWGNIPGLTVDRPEDLPHAVTVALADPPQVRDRRRRIADYVYGGGPEPDLWTAAESSWLCAAPGYGANGGEDRSR